MTALFALATSLLWGLADFGGGLLTRRVPALTVVVVSQTVAALVLGAGGGDRSGSGGNGAARHRVGDGLAPGVSGGSGRTPLPDPA
ncbi:hypothetical protein ACWD6R_07600 [Streptomyces sp. NPDC005151]